MRSARKTRDDILITSEYFINHLEDIGTKNIPPDILELTEQYFKRKEAQTKRTIAYGFKPIANKKQNLIAIQRFFARMHNNFRTPEERETGRLGLILTSEYSYLFEM